MKDVEEVRINACRHLDGKRLSRRVHEAYGSTQLHMRNYLQFGVEKALSPKLPTAEPVALMSSPSETSASGRGDPYLPESALPRQVKKGKCPKYHNTNQRR
jgi:hypothetical protein